LRSKVISHIHIGSVENFLCSIVTAPDPTKKNVTLIHFFGRKKQANAHELLPVLAEVLKALLSGTGLEVVRFLTQ